MQTPHGRDASRAVTLRAVRQGYDTPDGPLTVLDGIDAEMRRGEMIAITGPSGSGKTTLLSLIGGLERPREGTILVEGIDVTRLETNALAAYRRTTVGFVFQDFGLLGQLTAVENVELALTFARTSRRARRTRARELLDAVGLSHRLRHRPHALSGGENQRVAIARALANEPRLVLADEPTGNLDAASTEAVLDVVCALPREHGCTVVVVTHDDLVAARADRRLHLVGGRIDTAVSAR